MPDPFRRAKKQRAWMDGMRKRARVDLLRLIDIWESIYPFYLCVLLLLNLDVVQ